MARKHPLVRCALALCLWAGCSNEFVSFDAMLPCRTDADCAAGRVCVDGSCFDEEAAPLPAYAIVIRDVSSGESCGGPSPGTDLFAVALTDGSGEVVALGEPVPGGRGFTMLGSNNEFREVANWHAGLDQAQNLSQCPEFSSAAVVSLGCGGSAFLTFRPGPWVTNPSGAEAALEAGERVFVYEYGTQCQTAQSQPLPELIDAYDVSLCPKPVYEPGDDSLSVSESECVRMGAKLSGFSSTLVEWEP